MMHSQLLRTGLLVTLLIIGLTGSLFLYTRLSSAPSYSPIPAATLAAFQAGIPIENPAPAFIAAQVHLGTTRLHALGDILPYDAQAMVYAEARARTTQPGVNDYTTYPENTRVWLVLFEGQWQVEPPVQEPTPTGAQPGCVYAILSAQDGSGLGAGGIRSCEAYQVRPAKQIVNGLLHEKEINARPGTRNYGRLMKQIMLGKYPELTDPNATLVRNQAELESVLEYVAQHARDGTWYWGPRPTEPALPEALPPATQP